MSNYQVANDGEKYYFKLSGKLRYTESGGFDSLISHLIEKNKCSDAIIDLSSTNYLDSTNLGIIAQLAGHVLETYERKISLIISNPDINAIFENCGFNEICNIINSNDEKFTESLEFEKMNSDERDRTSMMLEAHQKLVSMNEKNKDKFQDVVDLMQESLD